MTLILVQILALLSFPLICLLWGAGVFDFLQIRLDNQFNATSAKVLFGLVVVCYLTLILKTLGFSWGIVVALIWILPQFKLWHMRSAITKAFRFKITFNFCLFFFIVLYIGTSLFDLDTGIKTIWFSNYGDLPYHFGMITSFAFGENFPPEYHLYPGEQLSYPFLINLWTALLWQINQSWIYLDLIFCYQWVFLWILIYRLLDADRFLLLPWAILFGGGVFLGITQNSAELISAGLGWTTLIETIWVPQRSALFGLVAFVFVARELAFALSGKVLSSSVLLVLGLLIALMPLMHTYFWMLSWAFSAFYLLYRLYQKDFSRRHLILLGFLLLSCVWLLFLNDKQGVLDFMQGWATGDDERQWLSLIHI